MNIRTIRQFVVDTVTSVVDTTTTTVSIEGDVSKPDALQSRVRIKVLPNETTKAGLGLTGKKEGAGLVQVDVFCPLVQGLTLAEDIAETIRDSIPFVTYPLDDGSNLHVWSVWVDQVIEGPAYFHIPVFIRWTLLHS